MNQYQDLSADRVDTAGMPPDTRGLVAVVKWLAAHKRFLLPPLIAYGVFYFLLAVLILPAVVLHWWRAPVTSSDLGATIKVLGFTAALGLSARVIVTFWAGPVYWKYRRTYAKRRSVRMNIRNFAFALLVDLFIVAWAIRGGEGAGHTCGLIAVALIVTAALWTQYDVSDKLFSERWERTIERPRQRGESNGFFVAPIGAYYWPVRSHFRRVLWDMTHQWSLSALDRTLVDAVLDGYSQNVDAFLVRGANPNVRLKYDIPLITVAAAGANRDIVASLIHAGADVSSPNPITGHTALHNAADNGRLGTVEMLLAGKATVDARLSSGETPLMLAARNGYADIAALLLDAGAYVNASSDNGLTALIFAIRNGSAVTVALLLARGAKTDLATSTGAVALDFAKRLNKADVLRLLTDADAARSGAGEVAECAK